MISVSFIFTVALKHELVFFLSVTKYLAEAALERKCLFVLVISRLSVLPEGAEQLASWWPGNRKFRKGPG